jgi:hypothetical protein
MIENFKDKFGTPDKVIIIFGDHDKGSHNMRGLEPSICKKFRRIFKNAGYKFFLINEFRTSSPFQGFQSKIGSCLYINNIMLNKYIYLIIFYLIYVYYHFSILV